MIYGTASSACNCPQSMSLLGCPIPLSRGMSTWNLVTACVRPWGLSVSIKALQLYSYQPEPNEADKHTQECSLERCRQTYVPMHATIEGVFTEQRGCPSPLRAWSPWSRPPGANRSNNHHSRRSWQASLGSARVETFHTSFE